MRTVGLKTLKNRLSEYVRDVAAGEVVLVTDRGRIVAKLVPPQVSSRSKSADEAYAELIHAGLITPARRKDGSVPPSHPIMTFETLMQELDQDRADR